MTSPTTPPIPYFYPRPPRGGRPPSVPHFGIEWYISIHALREEGDVRTRYQQWDRYISIHALREEGDPMTAVRSGHGIGFLSTPSARRATQTLASRRRGRRYFYPRPLRGGRLLVLPVYRIGKKHFYPRPLRGGRPCFLRSSRRWWSISIHALCEEGDLCLHLPPRFRAIFLSTPSARRATCKNMRIMGLSLISIHALCEEGDMTGAFYAA